MRNHLDKQERIKTILLGMCGNPKVGSESVLDKSNRTKPNFKNPFRTSLNTINPETSAEVSDCQQHIYHSYPCTNKQLLLQSIFFLLTNLGLLSYLLTTCISHGPMTANHTNNCVTYIMHCSAGHILLNNTGYLIACYRYNTPCARDPSSFSSTILSVIDLMFKMGTVLNAVDKWIEVYVLLFINNLHFKTLFV